MERASETTKYVVSFNGTKYFVHFLALSGASVILTLGLFVGMALEVGVILSIVVCGPIIFIVSKIADWSKPNEYIFYPTKLKFKSIWLTGGEVSLLYETIYRVEYFDRKYSPLIVLYTDEKEGKMLNSLNAPRFKHQEVWRKLFEEIIKRLPEGTEVIQNGLKKTI